VQCDEGCLKCNLSSSNCSACQTDYPFNKYTSRCLKICELGYYQVVDSTNKLVCEKCESPCTECY
jgi:hypothetical protein